MKKNKFKNIPLTELHAMLQVIPLTNNSTKPVYDNDARKRSKLTKAIKKELAKRIKKFL